MRRLLFCLILGVAHVVTTANLAPSVRQVFSLTASNISAAALATNLNGLTMLVSGLDSTWFYAYNQTAFAPVWKFSPPVPPQAIEHIACVGARHIEKDDPNIEYNLTTTAVDGLVTAQYDSEKIDEVALYGVLTNASSQDRLAQWRYLIEGSDFAPTFPRSSSVQFSDDGAVAAMVVSSGLFFNFHAIRAQPGQPLPLCEVRLGYRAIRGPFNGLMLNRNGVMAALALGSKIFFYNTTTCDTYAPTLTTPTTPTAPLVLCPMGVFLVSGGQNVAHVYEFDGEKKTYESFMDVQGGNVSNAYSLARAAISVNGSWKNPKGCLLTLAWKSTSENRFHISMHSLLTKKQFWDYVSPAAAGPVSIDSIAVHLQYVAVAISGPPLTGFPTLVVLSVDSNRPLFALSTYDFHAVDVFSLPLPSRTIVVAAVGSIGSLANTTALAFAVDV